jgi:hypothetical protein
MHCEDSRQDKCNGNCGVYTLGSHRTYQDALAVSTAPIRQGQNCCCSESWRCNCRDGGGGGEGAKGKMPERALRSHAQGMGVRSVTGAHSRVYDMRSELGRPTFGGGCR